MLHIKQKKEGTQLDIAFRITELQADLSLETQRREQFEEEVECTHKWLDEQGAPRVDGTGEVFSLVGRIMRLPPI